MIPSPKELYESVDFKQMIQEEVKEAEQRFIKNAPLLIKRNSYEWSYYSHQRDVVDTLKIAFNAAGYVAKVERHNQLDKPYSIRVIIPKADGMI